MKWDEDRLGKIEQEVCDSFTKQVTELATTFSSLKTLLLDLLEEPNISYHQRLVEWAKLSREKIDFPEGCYIASLIEKWCVAFYVSVLKYLAYNSHHMRIHLINNWKYGGILTFTVQLLMHCLLGNQTSIYIGLVYLYLDSCDLPSTEERNSTRPVWR